MFESRTQHTRPRKTGKHHEHLEKFEVAAKLGF